MQLLAPDCLDLSYLFLQVGKQFKSLAEAGFGNSWDPLSEFHYYND